MRPFHRGEVSVDPDPEAQPRLRVIETSDDPVDAEPLLVPVVGGREEGAGASMRVELGDHPCGRHVGEGRGRPGLRRHHQPVGAPVPSNGEEPLGVRVVPEPAQTQLEQSCRDGAVGELHLVRNGSETPHRAGCDRHPSRQVCALGLDVEAAQTENVVVADPLDTGESAGVADQVAYRPRSGASLAVAVAKSPLGDRHGLGHRALGNQVLHRVFSLSIYLLP